MRSPSPAQINRIQVILLSWGKEHFASFPWRLTDNKFHGLIAETLLQRTRAEQVVPVFELFSKRYSSAGQAAIADPTELLDMLRPLGLNWRCKKIVELIRELDLRNGTVPTSMDELLKLPGVGVYAASAFLTFHTNKRALIIDSNAVRLWCRIFGFSADGETRRKKWFSDIVEAVTPIEEHRAFNYAVLDHTRTICKTRPLCNVCPLNQLCDYYNGKIGRKSETT
jgi:A/G-specific adenine glycosylase